MLPATTSPGAATTATTVNKPVRSPASLDNIEMMAARAAIVTPDAILSSSGTCRTQTEAENLKSRAPRPFTLLINGMSVGTCNEASQVTIGCVLSSKSIPHKRSSTTRSSLERGNSLTPVYCYKADANTSKESCRSKRYKMLPAGTYCLAEKIKEKELYRTGLFPHVTSGHFEAGGVWKPPKLKTLEESYAQQYNEMVCTHYSPECIDCFLITSESSLFSTVGHGKNDWYTAISSALKLQQQVAMPPKPFVFYNVAGGRFSRPYTFAELFPGKTLEEVETRFRAWGDYALGSSFDMNTINRLAWHYPPDILCQRLMESPPVIPSEMKKKISANSELVSLWKQGKTTPELYQAVLRQGADPNLYVNSFGYHSIVSAVISTALSRGHVQDARELLGHFEQFGLDFRNIRISSHLLLNYPCFCEELIRKGAKAEWKFSLDYLEEMKEPEFKALLKSYSYLFSRGDSPGDIIDFLPESIDQKHFPLIENFFKQVNQLQIPIEQEKAQGYIDKIKKQLLTSPNEEVKKLDEKYKKLWNKNNTPNELLMDQYFAEKASIDSHCIFIKNYLPSIAKEIARIPHIARVQAEPPVAKTTDSDSLEPLYSLFSRPETLTLSNPQDLNQTTREILDYYYLSPGDRQQVIDTLNSKDPDSHLMRYHHGCDHVLRCMVIGDALMETFKKHEPAYKELFVRHPELEKLILIAILMHDITAEVGPKSLEEIKAAEAFEVLMKQHGFTAELVEKVASALRNKNTDTVETVAPPFMADNQQPEDVRLILRLLRLPDAIDITSVRKLPEEFPDPPANKDLSLFDFSMLDLGDYSTSNPPLVKEVKKIVVSAKHLACLTGAHTAYDQTYWQEHGLLNPETHHNIRRHWLASHPTPLLAMESVLDDMVRLDIAKNAKISIKSDLQLKQVSLPDRLSNRDKLLMTKGANNLPQETVKPLGTLTQEALNCSVVKTILLKRQLVIDEVDCWRKTMQEPREVHISGVAEHEGTYDRVKRARMETI